MMKAVNKWIYRNDFFSSIKKATGSIKDLLNFKYKRRVNKGYLNYYVFNSSKPNILERRKFNEIQYELVNFFKVSDKVYTTKNKNVFISNFDEMSTNILEMRDQYQRIKTEMNLNAKIKIDISPVNIETETDIKALIDKIREALTDGGINVKQKYAYKLCIHGGWKMYPIHSIND
ncbi:hypothetical protein QTN25_005035 [Entamoeba marina]